MGPAPSTAASITSRAKPVARDASVNPPTVNKRPSMGLWPLPCRAESRLEFTGCAALRSTAIRCRPRSAPQRLPYRLDDAVLRRFLEIGVHRQTDHLIGKPFADLGATLGNGKMPVWCLAVQRDRIIDPGGDALRLERGCEPVALTERNANGVLRPYRGRAMRHLGNLRHVGKALRIALRNALARDDLLGKNFQLLDQYGGLHRVEPPVESDAYRFVFVASFAMYAQAAERERKLVIVGEHRPAIAVAAERLCRKEARGGCWRQRANPVVLV